MHRKEGGAGSPGPRMSAVNILSQWLSMPCGKRPLLEALAERALRDTSMGNADRALFWEIVFGTARWMGFLQSYMEEHIRRFSRLPLRLRCILLTGAYQAVFLSRVPCFSAVDESVEAAKDSGFRWAAGLVNAVLRKICAAGLHVPDREEILSQEDSPGFPDLLARLTAHPGWMVRRWIAQWGRCQAARICFSNNERPDIPLRVNSLKIDMAGAVELLKSSSHTRALLATLLSFRSLHQGPRQTV